MKNFWTVLVLLLTCGAAWAQPPTADDALARLIAGNKRYVLHKEHHPDTSIARRKALVAGQQPFAVVLGCADSRVPPELLFDQGLGDLFVVRVAGNIVDDTVLGSIEYAVEHLGTRLIVVLGHEKCGAVSAAIEGGHAPGHVESLVAAIQPSVESSAKEPGDKVHNCVIANVRRVTLQVRESEPILRDAGEKHGVRVVAADYALESGKVNFLDAK